MPTPSGKTALITGASVGIGRDLAELFAADGHDVILTSRNEAQLQQVAADLRSKYGITATVIAKDLSIPGAPAEIFDAVQKLEKTAGKIGTAAVFCPDFLVNNAGFGSYGPFAESNIENELGMIQVNIAALTHLTRLFLPLMLQRRAGRIMNLSSLAAFFPGPLMAVYYATKAYVLSFSEAVQTEVAGSGVTVTAVCPGPTTTEFGKRAGTNISKHFSPGVMTSPDVARIGYQAMMRGKRTVVTGYSNKIFAFASRLVPRGIAARTTMKLNQSR
jgi:short-subunit dehydrogenase